MTSVLFLEKMEESEAILMKGARKFAEYTGYGNTLLFKGCNPDEIKEDNLDSEKRLENTFIAIDAIKHKS